MSDVFVSYASEDRATAQRLAAALEAKGWSVFWDRKTPPGRTWEDWLREQLRTTKCVVVLWSKVSVRSEWVKIEASKGRQRGVLVPATLGRGRGRFADCPPVPGRAERRKDSQHGRT